MEANETSDPMAMLLEMKQAQQAMLQVQQAERAEALEKRKLDDAEMQHLYEQTEGMRVGQRQVTEAAVAADAATATPRPQQLDRPSCLTGGRVRVRVLRSPSWRSSTEIARHIPRGGYCSPTSWSWMDLPLAVLSGNANLHRPGRRRTGARADAGYLSE
ncbi:hypothetical protein SEPCBS119000_002037 [Sporothrix epigloea]|uniref:Uncharacterized protein n=1 Tax=Sporothrix epigloea TaxID=1892477 RepID=A0ABP0DDZ0_9PEZI